MKEQTNKRKRKKVNQLMLSEFKCKLLTIIVTLTIQSIVTVFANNIARQTLRYVRDRKKYEDKMRRGKVVTRIIQRTCNLQRNPTLIKNIKELT
jgi:hypothetical protein